MSSPSTSRESSGLSAYGWDDRLQSVWKEADFASSSVPGRVVLQQRGVQTVMTAEGEVETVIAGRLRHAARGPQDLPVIGDWVVIDLAARAEGGPARIEALLPRATQVQRKAAGERTEIQVVAANVDTVFIVMGLDGDFNLRRLERFLATAWESGAQPVVILNKADLASQLDRQVRATLEAAGEGVPVVVVQAKHGVGLEAIDEWLEPGRTIVLVGSSGAGKSTLINGLAGFERMRTGAVRGGDDRGKHTTTHRELIKLPQGALLIDNPGIRELQLWGGEGLEETFEDVEELAGACRFRDCRHTTEPGCAVQAAIADGSMSAARFESWTRLQKEIAHLEIRQDQGAALAEKKKWREIHRAMRKHPKKR